MKLIIRTPKYGKIEIMVAIGRRDSDPIIVLEPNLLPKGLPGISALAPQIGVAIRRNFGYIPKMVIYPDEGGFWMRMRFDRSGRFINSQNIDGTENPTAGKENLPATKVYSDRHKSITLAYDTLLAETS